MADWIKDQREDVTRRVTQMSVNKYGWGTSTNGFEDSADDIQWGTKNSEPPSVSNITNSGLDLPNDSTDGNEGRGRGRGGGGRGRGRGIGGVTRGRGIGVTRGRGIGGVTRGSGECRKCYKEGHIARDCPLADVENDRPQKGCFRCYKEGHIARDCPLAADSTNGNSKPRKGCYNCGEDGHLSRDCSRGLVCRNCNESGHMAKDCTQPRKTTFQNGEEKPPPVTYVPVELDEGELFKQGISAGSNFSAFDNVAVKVSGSGDIAAKMMEFSETGLRPLLLQNVSNSGYRKPTPIQKHAIPIIMSGRDLMGCAQTGSGKTAAFLLPILHYVLENNVDSNAFEDPVRPVGLILSPTRELCIQIFNEARKFALGSVVKVCISYGGTSVVYQRKAIQKGCHILVATPGRLLDYVEKLQVSFECLKFLVLDEADRMLDMGFKSAIDQIVLHPSTPEKSNRQTFLFSATFAKEIQELAKKYLNDYVFVVTGMVGAANSDVKQIVLNVDKSSKREMLLSFIREQLERDASEKILVFVETKRMADFLAHYLSDQSVNSTSIHGDRFQNQREEALSQFKAGIRNVLVATAVAARGLDIRGVGTVVNFDMPKEIDEYVHRIGRTGRVGNPGRAVSYFDETENAALARSLLKLLSDAEQEVPEWLVHCANSSFGVVNYHRSDFGASDIRNKGVRMEEFPAACAVALGGPSTAVSEIPDEDCWD